MTETSLATSTPIDAVRGHHHCDPKLRQVLRMNAANCVVSGTALAVAAGPIDGLLDTGHLGWVRLVGLGLLPFAARCRWVSAESSQRLHTATPFIIVGDITWVIASVVTALLGWYSGGGIVAALAMAAVVDAFTVLQSVGWQRLRMTNRLTR